MAGFRSIPLLLLILFKLPHLQAQPDREIDWEYEIDLLGRELAQKHKNLFFTTDSIAFFHELEQIAASAPGQSLFNVSVKLQQAVAHLGDAHTRINYHFNIEADAILPLEAYWFKEGLYILETRDEYREILGNRITHINGFPLEVVIDSLATLVADDNQSLVKAEIPRMITWTQLLEHFGFANRDSIHIVSEDATGHPHEQLIQLPCSKDSETIRVEPHKVPLGWEDQNSFFRDHYFGKERIYYIQYNKCWSREVEEEHGSGASALFMPSFKEFEKRVFQTIRKQEIDKLVFDMRFNGGGNSDQGTRFIEKLCRAKYHGDVKFYVLISRHTFSSAVINTVDFMKNTDVVIVGEGTGGRPNHYGEVNRFVLPESNLVVSYSTKYFTLLPEDVPSILPDLLAPVSFTQFMKGIDPALELIRSQPTD